MSSLRSSFPVTFWTPFFSAKINQEIMTCANPITLPTQDAGTTGRREMYICVSLCLHRSVCTVKAWDENLSFILYFCNSQIKVIIWSNLFGFVIPVYISYSVFQETCDKQHSLCESLQSSPLFLACSLPRIILTCKLSAVNFLLGVCSLLVAFLGYIHIILLCCCASIKVI